MFRRLPFPWRRLAALWLLGLHFGGLGWTAPLVALSAALLDADHAADLQPAGQGTRIVLVHRGVSESLGHAHRHGQVASMLVAFSAPSSPGEPDHVLEFGSGSGVLRTEPNLAAPPPAARPVHLLPHAGDCRRPAVHLPVCRRLATDRSGTSGAARLTRTVVLVI